MLSEPLAFAYAGWTCGTILLIFYGFLTCYTYVFGGFFSRANHAHRICSAKILAHFLSSDPRLRSYADIGRKAFGARATPFVTFFFCSELFIVSVAFVTLYADSLETVLPSHSANFYKVIGLIV